MSQPSLSSLCICRVLVGAGMALLALTVISPAVAQPGTASPEVSSQGALSTFGQPTVNTHSLWDGQDGLFGFGWGVQTMGQVITVPPGQTDLVAFRYYLTFYEGTPPTIVRGEVYRWDGAKAEGAGLWEGVPQTLRVDRLYRRVTFDVGGVQLNPGAQYVLFMTVSKDYEDQSPTYWVVGALPNDDSYPLGSEFALSDGGDESEWTTQPWATNNYDLAMKVWLRAHV